MNANTGNPVTSFETGIIVSSGIRSGICIKWSFFDGSELLSHWELPVFNELMSAIHEYGEHGRHENLMFKIKENPELVKTLPARHPYFTLLSEVPKLTEAEIGVIQSSTKVKACVYVDRGKTFELRVTYFDGNSGTIYLHEYTAFSLWGYIREAVEAYDKLSSHNGEMH